MIGSTFGHSFRLTTFGESHGLGLGGIVDGCVGGLSLDEAFIQKRLDERRPGFARESLAHAQVDERLAGTKRKEADKVQLLSGVFEGKTTGTPIAFVVYNEDQRSKDYDSLSLAYRPGHADMSYMAKYGQRDHRGGGRASARETLARVAGGAIAECFLQSLGVELYAAAVELGGIAVDTSAIDMLGARGRAFFAASDDVVAAWEQRIGEVRKMQDSLGGIVRLEARQVPPGLGEPVFQKLDAMLAAALMSVGAVKGVEVGAGFRAARLLGSENNDAMLGKNDDGSVSFGSNNSGGILGGISSGQDIVLHAAIKPIPSIGKEQQSIRHNGETCSLSVGGRHDICAIGRVVPVLKAMLALTLADAVLMQRRF